MTLFNSSINVRYMQVNATEPGSKVSYEEVPDDVLPADLRQKIEQVLAQKESNGDFTLTEGRTRVYVLIDATGGTRQGCAGVQASATLAHVVGVSSITGALIPLGLLITGPLSMGTAVFWTLPDAYAALKTAQENLKKL
jgi:hypothetical protein